MYKVYLKHKGKHGSEVDPSSRTTTPDPEAARIAFINLIKQGQPIFQGQPSAAVLSLNNKQLHYHRFDREPGYTDYVDIEKPIRMTL